MKKPMFVTFLVMLVLLISSSSVAVLAQDTGPSTSEAPLNLESSLFESQVIGDDPDEVGYIGPAQIPQVIQVSSSSGEEGLSVQEVQASPNQIVEGPDIKGWTGTWQNAPLSEAATTGDGLVGEAMPDWDTLLKGEPDYVDLGLQASPESELTTVTDYYYVAGVAFRPRSSSTSWQYYSQCLMVPQGNEWLITPFRLPDGATIEGLRLFYYDTSAKDSNGWITRFNGSGTVQDLIYVHSTDAAGYGSFYTSANHLVDNQEYSYVLYWRANQTGPTMRLCGMRVFYSLP